MIFVLSGMIAFKHRRDLSYMYWCFFFFFFFLDGCMLVQAWPSDTVTKQNPILKPGPCFKPMPYYQQHLGAGRVQIY